MARTRSQPLSPGGYQSLDDLPPRRRATRSASSAEPTTESQPEAAKTRKPRAKKSTTTKKTTRRPRSKVAKSPVSDLKQTSPAVTEQPEALAGASADQQDMCSDAQMAQSATDTPSRPPLSNIVNSRALGPQHATPIMRRRPRVPYASITARRRSNAGGRVVHTLFQLENLVNQSTITESAATDNTEEIVPIARDPVTPEPTIPTTPKTAPAASTGVSPSWSRRIINNVSSRWSSFRGRISPRKPEGSQDLAAENTAPSTSTTDLIAPQPEGMGANTVTRPVRTETEMAVVSTTPLASASTPRRSSLSRARPPRERASSFNYASRQGGGFSKETLAKCYERSRALPSSGLSNEALEVLASEKGNKRKRSSPESIPNPPGCSYGMHDDYFTFDDDDEVWAEQEKAERAAEAAKAAEAENEETVQPPLKKQRVAEKPDQPRSRHVLHSQTPRKAESRPGYPHNRKRLYKATNLSPIESSDFLSEGSHGPDVTQTRPNINTAPFTANTQGTFQTPGWDSPDSPSSSDSEDYPSSGPRLESTPTGMYQAIPSSPADIFFASSPAPRIFTNPNPHGTFRTPYSSDTEDEDMDVDMDMDSPPKSNIAGADPMDEDTLTPARTNNTTAETPTQDNESSLSTTDPSPLTRVRNKAQQFKPKTPSRLREASRFSTGSINSSPLTNETTFPAATPVTVSDPMSLDGSSYLQPAKTGDDKLLDSGKLEMEDIDPEDLEDIDSHWLDKICPSGDFNHLAWPPLTVKEIGIIPKSTFMDDAKTEEAVNHWQKLFESGDW